MTATSIAPILAGWRHGQKYAPIEVVLPLMSSFIAIGVVIIMGVATGMVGHDCGLSFGAAVRKLRQTS